MKKGIAVFILIILSSLISEAQINLLDERFIHEQQKTLSPYFQITSESTEVEQFPLLFTKADVSIAGVIAEVTVTQVYRNTGKTPIEAIYVFPASVRAAVFAMKMTIGDRVLIAEIQKREEARATYEKAKQEGKSTSLLEQQRPNVFQMNVANIMPGDSIVVELKYTELLIPSDKTYEFVYPTVVGPRYSNQKSISSDTKDIFVETPYQHEGENPKYKFDININLTTGVPLNEVVCNTHKIGLDRISKNEVKIELDNTEKFGSNKDFVLKYKLVGDKIETGLILSEKGNEKFFLLMLQPPTKIEPENLPSREYIFVIDVSGSMHGYPLDVSKELMTKLLNGLKPTDKFNILFFSGSSQILYDESKFATEGNIKEAAAMMTAKSGGGGTELLPALEKIYNYPKEKSYSRTIIILTDGFVDVEKQAFELIRNKLSDANVFAFGIGNSVNRYLIEGIARAGFGEPFIIMNQKEAPEKVEKFFNYINSPIMTNIKIEYDGFDAYQVEPKSVPDVFADRPIILYGKWNYELSGNIIVSGLLGTKKYKVEVNVLKFANRLNNDALKYLWVRNKISELNDFRSSGFDEGIVKEVTELGLKYNLLTEYTSFIAVDYLKRNKGDSVITVKQALPLPEGVSDYAVGYSGIIGRVANSVPPLMNSTDYSIRGSRNEEILVHKSGFNKVNGLQEDDTLSKPKVQLDEHIPPLVDIKLIQKNVLYPKEAIKAGLEGKVILRVLVGIDGIAKDIEVTDSDFELLNKAAFVAVFKTTFSPAKVKGVAIEEWLTLPIQFKLDDDDDFKVNLVRKSTGNKIQINQKLKIKWTANGIYNNVPEIIEGEFMFVLGKEEKYNFIEPWFIDMKIGEERKVTIPESKAKEILNLFNMMDKLNEVNTILFELGEAN